MSTPPPLTGSIVFILKCLERWRRSTLRCLRLSWVIFDSRFVAPSPLLVCYCFWHSHEHSHSTSQRICTILTHANSSTHSNHHTKFVHGFTLNATQYYLKFKYSCELNLSSKKWFCSTQDKYCLLINKCYLCVKATPTQHDIFFVSILIVSFVS